MRWVTLLLVGFLAAPALGYVRSQTSRGHALWWEETNLLYNLDLRGSDDLCGPDGADEAAARQCVAAMEVGTTCSGECEFDAVMRSFQTWHEVVCDDGPFRMEFTFDGFLDAPAIEYVHEGENQNIITWIEDRTDWIHSSVAVIGVTSATYDAETGRILDADIEFNGFEFEYTTTGSPIRVRTDVQNTVTHEIGHLLGLDHTPVEGATMEARAPEGETRKRTLAQDDIVGLCSVRPLVGGSAAPKTEAEGGGCATSSVALDRPGLTAWQWWLTERGFLRRR